MRATVEGLGDPSFFLDQTDDVDRARKRSNSSLWRDVSSLRFRVYPRNASSVGGGSPGIYEVNVRNGIVMGARIATDGVFSVGAEPPFLAPLEVFTTWLFELENQELRWDVWSPDEKDFIGPDRHYLAAISLIMGAFKTKGE